MYIPKVTFMLVNEKIELFQPAETFFPLNSEAALCLLLTLEYFYQIDLMFYLPKVGFHRA